ncbi:MAG: DUF3775 domain-containing protein [Pseudomonadota bacterium]
MLKELTPVDIREIADLAAKADSIDRPREYAAVDFGGPQWAEWQAASARLADRIGALSELARSELTALAWLGRGDSGEDFGALLELASRSGGEGRSRYLAAKFSLRAYLEDGARKLGITI